MKRWTRVLIALLIVIAVACFVAYRTKGQPLEADPNLRRQGEPLRSKMRTLWVDHISFTRDYIISSLANLKDADAVAARLMKNQDEIADELRPYYGAAYCQELALLLRAHIRIAADLVAAEKADDRAGIKRVQLKWAANGAELTAHLSAANPHWSRQDVAAMLKDHLELTTREIEDRLAKDWKGDLENFDKLHAHMLMFSDFLVTGLEQQFRKDPKLPASSLPELEAGTAH